MNEPMSVERMTRLQKRVFFGTVTFRVKGEQLVRFFQYCAKENIPLSEISLLNKTEAQANVSFFEWNKINIIAKQLHFTIDVISRTGFLISLLSFWNKKEKIIAIFLCAMLLFFLSNLVWNVQIKGVSTHLEIEITNQLKQMGIYKGALFTSRLSLDTVEQNMMETLPELLYINVKKHGTIYTIEAAEKKQETQEEPLQPTNLIASKSGVIKRMLVKEGQANVQVNDFVKKGDLLVSGTITIDDESNEEEKKEQVQLTAEGRIIANTWYEINVSSKLLSTIERLEGDKVNHYYIHFGKIQVPLFNLKRVPFDNYVTEYERIPLTIFEKTLPFHIIRKTMYKRAVINEKRTKEQAKEIAINHAISDLEKKLGKDAEIIKYYILHEQVDNGKVKLRLYVSMLENIASTSPIKSD